MGQCIGYPFQAEYLNWLWKLDFAWPGPTDYESWLPYHLGLA